MQIYINKNNQQLGPFEETKVLEMLQSGQLSLNDLAIKQGQNQWQKLSDFYPNAGSKPVAKVEVEQPKPKKSRTGLLLGCGGFFLISLLVAGVLGFLAYRNMYPADSLENLPNSVKDLKLDTRYPPKGNIWGTETIYLGLYRNEAKSKSVLYLMTEFSSEDAAKKAFRDELVKSCKSGETPFNFSFVDKNNVEVSQGATCAIPFYVQKDNKLVTLGGGGASASDFIEFAENIPFNSGTKMIKKENK